MLAFQLSLVPQGILPLATQLQVNKKKVNTKTDNKPLKSGGKNSLVHTIYGPVVSLTQSAS
jgi:hypothetical protein